jgi:hypothetical protein
MSPLGILRRRGWIAALTAPMVAVGCDVFTGDCISLAKPAIRLEVRESGSGGQPASPSSIVVTDGDFQDQYPPEGLEAVKLGHYDFALGRTGTYTIVVRTPGYHDWSQSDVRVTADGCGLPKTETVSARISLE